MYIKIILTLVLLALGAIAAEVWRPQPLPAEVHPARPLAAGDLKLREHVEHLDLRDLSREDAIAQLQTTTGATLVVDWRSLAEAWRDDEKAYRSFKLKAVVGGAPLQAVLKGVLGHSACFQVDGSVISIARDDTVTAREMTVRGFDVSDLISDDYWGVRTPDADVAAVRAARMERVRDVVAQHDGGASWHINYMGSGTPGGNASISVLGATLVVTQTTDGHENIARILAELRRSHLPVR